MKMNNILKNILESYTFEDASQNIENFDDKITDDEFKNYDKDMEFSTDGDIQYAMMLNVLL